MMLKHISETNDARAMVSASEKVTAVDLVNVRVPTDPVDTGAGEKEPENGVVVEITENLKEMYQQQLESAKKAAKQAAEGAEELGKILEIARRISRGDKVPASDEQKLAQYDSDLYQMAKASALLHANEKHKRHKALFKDENEESIDDKLRDLKRENASSGGSVSDQSTSVTATEGPVETA